MNDVELRVVENEQLGAGRPAIRMIIDGHPLLHVVDSLIAEGGIGPDKPRAKPRIIERVKS